MLSLQTLSSAELLQKTKNTALEERRLGIELLHCLEEIERRKLFAPDFSSLHEYVVRELGYSDGAAHRRISAMRLMRDVPEVEQKLSSGSLTLSTASQVQSFLIAEKRTAGAVYSSSEKRKLISSIENKSTRDTEAFLTAQSPRTAALVRERPRSIDGHNVQVTVVLSPALQEKLERLKNLMSHQHPHPSLSEQLEMLADLALRKLDPSALPSRKAPATSVTREAARDASTTAHRSRFIPAATRRAVWQRADYRCEFRSTESANRCSRRHLLQVDHRAPFSRGGGNQLENLQLLCATHNQWKGARVVNSLTPFVRRTESPEVRPFTSAPELWMSAGSSDGRD